MQAPHVSLRPAYSTLTRAPANCGSGSDAAPSGDTRGSGVAAANAVCGPRLASAAASGCSASLLQSDLTATAAQAAASDSGVPSRPPEGERRMKRFVPPLACFLGVPLA